MVQQVELRPGVVALFDDDDAPEILTRRWRLHTAKSGKQYAVTGKRSVFMHHSVISPRPGLYIDHINGNGLDNRRSNLRLCTHAENMRNRRPQGGSSRFKGVSLNRATGKWRAGITLDGRTISLGTYENERDAAAAYDAAAARLFGEFAATNTALGLL